MTILVTILLFLVAVIAFLLLTPLIIEIDSDRKLYRVRLRGVVSVEVLYLNEQLLLQIWVLGWTKRIDIFHAIGNSRSKKDHYPAEKKKKQSIGTKTMLRKGKAVLRSFTVSFFYLDIDTDDYVINAWLYPIAHLLSKKNRVWHVNFDGKISLKIQITNRIAKILFALTK